MRIPRTWLRLALAFALLAFGVPAGGFGAAAAFDAPAEGAAGQSGFASRWDAPAVPETGARKAPEGSAAAAPGGAGDAFGRQLERALACPHGAPGVRTPLYLSHCAFLC